MKKITIENKRTLKNKNKYDLTRLLYFGGASFKVQDAYKKISNGELQGPIDEREELITAFRDALEASLVSGESTRTVEYKIHVLVHFIKFIEINNFDFKISSLKENYLNFCENLFHDCNLKINPRIAKNTAYGQASTLSSLISKVLDLPKQGSPLRDTRLKYSPTRKPVVSKKSEKQNLENTFIFGRFLYELTQALSAESILGQQPIEIDVKNEALNLKKIVISKGFKKELVRKDIFTREKKEVSNILEHNRWMLFNLRIQAEILVFSSQTGMNPSQIYKTKRQEYDYKALGENYEVRSYKPRKGGEVLFKIFKPYKKMLDDHIAFIKRFTPDSELLFPLFSKNGIGIVSPCGHFDSLKDTLKENNIPWISPSVLRKTRINWLLRRSGDEDLTSTVAQHTKKVLRSKYELPSQQRAMVEITQFWNKHDPISKSHPQTSVVLSECNGIPQASGNKPKNVQEPNCISPSGCLWCKNLRDLDSFEYVWSLFSMRHLKIIEASLVFKSEESPSDVVIERLTQKIDWFRDSSKKRSEWVDEAELRIEEGHYHPSWTSVIEFLE